MFEDINRIDSKDDLSSMNHKGEEYISQDELILSFEEHYMDAFSQSRYLSEVEYIILSAKTRLK